MRQPGGGVVVRRPVGRRSGAGRGWCRGQLPAGYAAALVEPGEPELAGVLGGELVLAAGELPVDLVVAVALVLPTSPAGWYRAIRST
jgi:hypothetical protein